MRNEANRPAKSRGCNPCYLAKMMIKGFRFAEPTFLGDGLDGEVGVSQ